MRNKIVLMIIVCIICGLIFLPQILNNNNSRIAFIYSTNDLSTLLEETYPSHLYIDLRDQVDYEAGHIKEFINIPSTDGSELDKYLTTNKLKNKKIYLMCYSGNRAAANANLLQSKGYNDIIYISFGYQEYVDNQTNFIPQVGQCDCLAAE